MLRRLLSLSILLAASASAARADDVSDLVDVPARVWRQSQPIVARLEKHSGKAPLRITVHYTDEPKNYTKPLAEKLRVLFHYSLTAIEGTKKKLWGDIPYHYYIDAMGKLGECRDPSFKPDSNTAYDRDGHITVVLEGNSRDGITGPQHKKLFALLQALQEKYRVPTARVGVHKNYAETDCPGDAITAAVKQFKESRGGLK